MAEIASHFVSSQHKCPVWFKIYFCVPIFELWPDILSALIDLGQLGSSLARSVQIYRHWTLTNILDFYSGI